jgi:hypothetical protein
MIAVRHQRLQGERILELNEPRLLAREAIKASLPSALWAENDNFVTHLRKSLKQHPIAAHPIIEALNKGFFGREMLGRIHLDYRHAIVQIFTDALLMAQYQSHQLEPRLSPGSKMYARFLLTLNDLDEFGFRSGVDSQGYYQGNPQGAHYPLFEQVLNELGIGLKDRLSYVHSLISSNVRKFLEDTYHDLSSVVSLLAVAEREVVIFSPPLRENAKLVGLNVSSGYYYCHGTNSDTQVEADDDTHEDDLWYVLTQSITPDDYGRITDLCQEYCNLWISFWDVQLNLLKEQNQSFYSKSA